MKKWVVLFSGCFSLAASAQNAAVRKGNAYYHDGDFTLAEVEYRKANSSTGGFNLANALIQQKKYKEALAVLEPLAQRAADPALKASAYYNAGVVYSRQKDLESSIEAYKAALRINPTDTDCRENLQKALLEKKRQEEERKKQRKESSRLPKSEAERQLQRLQEKERQLQQRLQKKQGGQSMEQDW